MSSARYVIGIDCSTTATKAVVWDERGRSVAEGRGTFPLLSPHPGWYEQDAEEWWRSIKTALKEAAGKIDPRNVKALGLTYPAGLDPTSSKELFKAYDANVGSATLVILDPLGRIAYYEQDPRPNAFGLFERVIERLLGGE